MNPLLIYLLFASCLLTSEVHATSVNDLIQSSTLSSPNAPNHAHGWVEINSQTNINLSEKGVTVGAGYRWNLFGVDLRGTIAQTTFGSIHGLTDANQNTSAGFTTSSTGAQSNLPRSATDTWNYSTLQPGFSILSRWMPMSLPLFYQRARVGFEWGSFADQVNQLNFTGYLFTCETSLMLELGQHSPWMVAGTLYWKTGNLVLNSNDATLTPEDKHLAVNWLGLSAGLLYSF